MDGLFKTDRSLVFIQASLSTFSFCLVTCYTRHVCLILTGLSNHHAASDHFCFVFKFSLLSYDLNTVYDKDTKRFAPHSKLVEEF